MTWLCAGTITERFRPRSYTHPLRPKWRHPFLERAPDLVFHSVACDHAARLLAGEPHQVRRQRDDGRSRLVNAEQLLL
jgi:hypothetical protein